MADATVPLSAPATAGAGSSMHIRAPAHHRTSTATSPVRTFTPPTASWLKGTWHVTHSTLPMWRNKRNVRITYTPLAPESASSSGEEVKIDDLVTYQSNSSTSLQKVNGVDTPKGDGAYGWRGKGWLKIASSQWEVLGFGEGDAEQEEQWAVTYFAKTLFTPAGIDVYSRRKEGLSEGLLQRVLGELKASVVKKGNEKSDFEQLVEALFEVKIDADMKDL